MIVDSNFSAIKDELKEFSPKANIFIQTSKNENLIHQSIHNQIEKSVK
jgi:hypothetical protein